MSQSKHAKIENVKHLFSPRLERLNLLFPLLFIVPVVWEFCFEPTFSLQDRNYGNFVAKILFLNHVHIYFSFALILWAPEIRNWVRIKSNEISFLKTRAFAVFLSVFAIYNWLLPLVKDSSSAPVIYECMIAVAAIVGLHHNYSQTLGLSLGYNQGARPSAVLERSERALVMLMMISQFSRMILLIVAGELKMLSMVLGATTGLAAVLLVVVGLCHPQSFKAKKFFMIRYLYFAAMPFSFTALIAMLANHGIEYFCVFRQMQNASIESSGLSRKVVTFGSVFFVAALTMLAVFGQSRVGYWITPLLPEDSRLALYLSSLAIAASFLHYHLDGLMFRMRDPSTAALVGPLLFNDSQIATVQSSGFQVGSRSTKGSNRLKRVAP
ncbi:hypothetical protein BH10BDE1_BH10BDE1_08050 [soil metagenome]